MKVRGKKSQKSKDFVGFPQKWDFFGLSDLRRIFFQVFEQASVKNHQNLPNLKIFYKDRDFPWIWNNFFFPVRTNHKHHAPPHTHTHTHTHTPIKNGFSETEDRQTDRQTYFFFRLKISEQGENSFILISLIIKKWSSHVKIRVWKQTCNYSES